MIKKHLLLAALFCSTIFTGAFAQQPVPDSVMIKPPVRRWYVGSGLDGAILSTASIKNSGGSANGILRFSYIINWGFTFNLNLNRHLGVYTGIDIKNIGFIEQVGGITIKRRTYNVGVPVGIKIGNLADKKPYIFLGGGVDVPVNYREKSFSVRNQKTRFNEWFSDRTPQVMPYVFAGLALNRGVTLKLQYYPNNFLNPDFSKNGSKPYAGYDVHVEMLSIGLAVPLKRTKGTMRLVGMKRHRNSGPATAAPGQL